MKKHDARRCMRCKYHGRGASQTICEYILEKNEPRGCPVGENCTRFEPGKRKQKTTSYVMTEAMKEEKRHRSEMIGYKGDALRRMHIK